MRPPLLFLMLIVLSPFACTDPVAEEQYAHFPIRGLHEPLGCADCHAEDLRAAVPEDCEGCHEGARPEEHYDGDCKSCHSESGWEFAVLDHDFFPLEFGHDGPTCLDCHVEDDFAAASPVCETCHAEDEPPNHHDGACSDCHNTVRWEDAVFDHDDFFPTPHNGVRACVDCHLDTPDNSTFSCIDCHEHSRARTDAQHRGETNQYRYESNACLECHPDGED